MEKKEVCDKLKSLFKEIDQAIENTKSDVPVRMNDSRFLKKYIEIKERYLNEH